MWISPDWRESWRLSSVEAIQADIRATQAGVDAVSRNGQSRHDELVAYTRDMDRRHTEILAAIAKRT